MPRAIGWAPELLSPTGGVIARPRFNPEPDSARCDREIEEVAETPPTDALLMVPQLWRSGKLNRPMNYTFFRRFSFFDHTGTRAIVNRLSFYDVGCWPIRVALHRRIASRANE
jgi:hypothetical protein